MGNSTVRSPCWSLSAATEDTAAFEAVSGGDFCFEEGSAGFFSR